MRRSWTGLLVILTAVLAAVVVPNLSAKSIVGTAVRAPIGGPAAVGDCLAESLTSPVWATDDRQPRYPNARLVPCTGIRFGEVVRVIPNGLAKGPVTTADPAGNRSTTNPNQAECSVGLGDFVGRPVTDWTLAFGFSVGAIGPSRAQIAAGQTWLACIAYFAGQDGNGNDLNTTVAYQTSARAVLTSGRLPPEMASCLATTATVRASSCATPHQAELFATISTNPPGTTAANLQSGCVALIGRYTAMADPLVDGRLTVQVRATHVIRELVIAGLGSPGDSTGLAACVLTSSSAGQLLKGPLLGLGPQAVPWA